MSEYTERARFEESRTIPQDERHCMHCKHAGWDLDGNYCAHPTAMKESHGFGRSCWTYRREGEACGPTGALFEPAERSET